MAETRFVTDARTDGRTDGAILICPHQTSVSNTDLETPTLVSTDNARNSVKPQELEVLA